MTSGIEQYLKSLSSFDGAGQIIKKTRIKHPPEFKAETLKLADKVKVAAAARQLSLHETQIYEWRKNSKKDANTSQREQELAAEVAKLKRQLVEEADQSR